MERRLNQNSRGPGPVLIGVAGTWLTSEERDWLQHPAVGGLVLFTRNYQSPSQLQELNQSVREAAAVPMLICVDHEGGRVQRFREGFTRLPPLAVLGRIHADSSELACDFAYRHGRVMATELLVLGVDMSFAPVLDLGGDSVVIGDRAFAPEPQVIAELAQHYLAGMHDAGMKACGKHFPGHGTVAADSHVDDVADRRSLAAIEAGDLRPFSRLVDELDSLMMAHVLYPEVDNQPAGYSRFWIREYLRGQLGYQGTVFSDDLGMHAALVAGKLSDRVRLSLEAGCDAVLICDPGDTRTYLKEAEGAPSTDPVALLRLAGKSIVNAAELDSVGEWKHWQASLQELELSKWA
jgi:beta-N-acetylhexosaminidase